MINQKDVVQMYEDQQKSISEIAEHFNVYVNKVRRMLIKAGVKLRGKSDAQKISIKNGRHYHPTKGRKRENDVKVAISEKMAERWKEYSPEKIESISSKAKERFANRSETEKENFKAAAIEGVQKAAKEGSKIERAVLAFLEKNGYSVVFHKKSLIENTNLEIDLFIPSIKTAIEIDGPSHFLNIWGEDKLNKVIKQDNEKNGLLISKGFNIIRVKHLSNHSQSYERKLCSAILEKVKYIEKEKCKSEFFEVEVNNARLQKNEG